MANWALEIERMQQVADRWQSYTDNVSKARAFGLQEAIDELRVWLSSGESEPAADLITRLRAMALQATAQAQIDGKQSIAEGRRRGLWRGLFLIASLLDQSPFGEIDTRPHHRCEGITAAGVRCPRELHTGAHYCWQHKKQADDAEALPTLSELEREIWG